jgi:hypothetical protein
MKLGDKEKEKLHSKPKKTNKRKKECKHLWGYMNTVFKNNTGIFDKFHCQKCLKIKCLKS